MMRKALSLLIVATIVVITLFLLKNCESSGGGQSPLAFKPLTYDAQSPLKLQSSANLFI